MLEHGRQHTLECREKDAKSKKQETEIAKRELLAQYQNETRHDSPPPLPHPIPCRSPGHTMWEHQFGGLNTTVLLTYPCARRLWHLAVAARLSIFVSPYISANVGGFLPTVPRAVGCCCRAHLSMWHLRRHMQAQLEAQQRKNAQLQTQAKKQCTKDRLAARGLVPHSWRRKPGKQGWAAGGQGGSGRPVPREARPLLLLAHSRPAAAAGPQSPEPQRPACLPAESGAQPDVGSPSTANPSPSLDPNPDP